MKNPRAKAIDVTKDRILYAGAALLVGLVAAALFSSNAHAKSADANRQKQKFQDEIKLPFELKSQKLSH